MYPHCLCLFHVTLATVFAQRMEHERETGMIRMWREKHQTLKKKVKDTEMEKIENNEKRKGKRGGRRRKRRR